MRTAALDAPALAAASTLGSPDSDITDGIQARANALLRAGGEVRRLPYAPARQAPTVHGTLGLLDDAGLVGELAVREIREGRTEVTQLWGRPYSVRANIMVRA